MDLLKNYLNNKVYYLKRKSNYLFTLASFVLKKSNISVENFLNFGKKPDNIININGYKCFNVSSLK